MSVKGVPESAERNALIRAVQKCGHSYRDFERAFGGITAKEIEQRFVDSGLATRRSAGKSGYLLSRPCESEFFNVGLDHIRLNRKTEEMGAKSTKTAGTIGIYGSSVAMGIGLADHETIASQLEQFLIERTGAQLKVLNFGNINHCALHSARHFLDRQLSEPKVDLAIFLDGWTDLFHAGLTGDGITALYDSLLAAQFSEEGLNHSVGELISEWRNSKLPVSSPKETDLGEDRVETDSDFERVIDQLRMARSIRHAVAAASSRACRVVEYFEPTIFFHALAEKVVMPMARKLIHRDAEMVDLSSQLSLRLLKHDASLVDRHLLSRDEDATLDYDLFLDAVHLTPRYTKTIAERIGESLLLERDESDNPDLIQNMMESADY